MNIELWRHVWRNGFQPKMPIYGLRKLLEALTADSPKLFQGGTTQPPPLTCTYDWPCEATDAVSYPYWQQMLSDYGDCSVGQVEEAFAKACYECDRDLGEMAACRYFLNWFDDMTRAEVFSELAKEISAYLKDKEVVSNGDYYTTFTPDQLLGASQDVIHEPNIVETKIVKTFKKTKDKPANS